MDTVQQHFVVEVVNTPPLEVEVEGGGESARAKVGGGGFAPMVCGKLVHHDAVIS